mmetsp:Transcript_14922/g.33166  ORF Transcript_14922/g.33166 Transcript_14922/m.33166 type:complete len:573 (-) Transcript_14922:371-2089(-)
MIGSSSSATAAIRLVRPIGRKCGVTRSLASSLPCPPWAREEEIESRFVPRLRPPRDSRPQQTQQVHSRPQLQQHVETISVTPLDHSLSSAPASASSGRTREKDSDSKWEHVLFLAQRKPTPLTLREMYRHASVNNTPSGRLINAQFLWRELPIRIAQRAVDLRNLPGGLGNVPGIRAAVDVYVDYVCRFDDIPVPTTAKEEEEFTKMLERLVLDRTSIPCAIARGLRSLRDERRGSHSFMHDADDALYRFFTARVGLRFLTEHHILTSSRWAQGTSGLLTHDPYYYENLCAGDTEPGCIRRDCDALAEARRVAADVSAKIREVHGVAPAIDIVDAETRGGRAGGGLGGTKKRSRRPFTYVPHHLRYMLEELLQNACVATIRRHLPAASADARAHRCQNQQALSVLSSQMGSSSSVMADEARLPPVTIVVVKGAEDVTLKIADQGGGVPRSQIDNIFRFSHSTVSDDRSKRPISLQNTPPAVGSDQACNSPVGKELRGFGVPLTRIYARYFGGELTLKSMEGYGLDAYLHLPVLGSSCENLNDAVLYSPGNLDSNLRYHRKDSILMEMATKAL